MTLRKIAHVGDPVLRAPTREISREELQSAATQALIDDLIETMRDADGAGLAANQVFEPMRICVVEVRAPNPRYPYKPPIPLTVLVNPRIEPLTEERFENFEGCLSVPDLRGKVKRYKQIRVTYLDRDGIEHVREVAGVSAGTFQHECDHLDGKVFLDCVEDPRTLTTWKNFERYHKARFVEEITRVAQECGS